MATLSVGTYDMIAEFTTGNANLVLTITEAVVEEMIKEEAENGIDNAQVDDTTTEEGQDGSGEAVEQGSNVWMILVGILVVAGIGGFLFFIGKKRKKEEEV